MGDMIEAALADFLQAARAARTAVPREKIEVEYRPAPHKPPSRLPAGRMAVYAFFYGDRCLKCGKAGPNSQARYVSQHYNPGSAPSTLAASMLLGSSEIELPNITPDGVGQWIKVHTGRLNLLVPADLGPHFLSFLEAFLHLRWRPVFEG